MGPPARADDRGAGLHVHTLARKAGEEVPDERPAEASMKIDELREKPGRGRTRRTEGQES